MTFRNFAKVLLLTVFIAAGCRSAAAEAGGILFVGSSIFEFWSTLERDMAPLPVTNRAIAGTQTPDWLQRLPAVIRERPALIVYYCGSNDIDAGETADPIVERIRQFIVKVNAELPATRFVYVSINRAPEKQSRWNVVDEVNGRIKAYAVQNHTVTFVDVNPALFNSDGSPRLELYVSDQLHLKPPAYVEFTRILKPVLERLYRDR